MKKVPGTSLQKLGAQSALVIQKYASVRSFSLMGFGLGVWLGSCSEVPWCWNTRSVYRMVDANRRFCGLPLSTISWLVCIHTYHAQSMVILCIDHTWSYLVCTNVSWQLRTRRIDSLATGAVFQDGDKIPWDNIASYIPTKELSMVNFGHCSFGRFSHKSRSILLSLPCSQSVKERKSKASWVGDDDRKKSILTFSEGKTHGNHGGMIAAKKNLVCHSRFWTSRRCSLVQPLSRPRIPGRKWCVVLSHY